MARNNSPKEGIDFEWVKGPGGSRMRKFFSRSEKEKREKAGGGPAKKSGSESTKRTTTKRKASSSDNSSSTPRPKSRPITPRPKARPGSDDKPLRPKSRPMRGRSRGAGGPRSDSERAEAEVSRTGERPFGPSRENMSKRRAYDRLEDEGVTMGSYKDKKEKGDEDRGPTKRRRAPTRHPRSFNKGGLVSNCGASMKPKRSR